MTKMNDIALLKHAVHTFKEETGLQITIIKNEFMAEGYPVDGLVELPNGAGQMAVEVKKWAPRLT